MTFRESRLLLSVALGMVLLLGGCGSAQRDATEAAVNAAQRAVNSAQDAAEKYAPEQFKAAQEALQSAKDEVAKSDYQGALKSAEDAVQKARRAISEAGARKEEWSKDWKDLSASVPKTLNEAKEKVDAYEKKGKLPLGISSDQMDEAKAQYEKL